MQVTSELHPQNDTEPSNNADEFEEEQKDVDTLQDDIKSLIGTKCRAPHRQAGTDHVSLHNGIIYDIETDNCNKYLVRVVFSHPTSLDMVPCKYYMDGKCSREPGQCKFSHGEIVKVRVAREHIYMCKNPQIWHIWKLALHIKILSGIFQALFHTSKFLFSKELCEKLFKSRKNLDIKFLRHWYNFISRKNAIKRIISSLLKFWKLMLAYFYLKTWQPWL